MQTLLVTIIQTDLHWENPEKNLEHFEEKINNIKAETDIIVLPEMFTTGFTMKPKLLAEPHEGKGLRWMITTAKQKKCVLVGSISITENDIYYNRLYWVNPDGSYQFYDKRHLFRMGNEHEHYQSGTEKIIIQYKGWKICPLICYDLRFPVWSRNSKENQYDVLMYVANWPEVRSYPWKNLLIARAIENQCYVVGVNRIGKDGHNLIYSGDSCVLNVKGELISTTKAHQDNVETISLSYPALQEFRKTFPVILDADSFKVF